MPDHPNTASCPDCGHSWNNHDRLMKDAGTIVRPEFNADNLVDLYQCDVYEGMGNWCGCENRSRQPLRKVHP